MYEKLAIQPISPDFLDRLLPSISFPVFTVFQTLWEHYGNVMAMLLMVANLLQLPRMIHKHGPDMELDTTSTLIH